MERVNVVWEKMILGESMENNMWKSINCNLSVELTNEKTKFEKQINDGTCFLYEFRKNVELNMNTIWTEGVFQEFKMSTINQKFCGRFVGYWQ